MDAPFRMRCFVGTSGYSYPWNPKRPSAFDWYIGQGFNTVEVNSTFYRFPSVSSIRTWSLAPPGFVLSVKVHRSITHYTRLGSTALWQKFRHTFAPIEDRIGFWLFQFPETFKPTDETKDRIAKFFAEIGLEHKAVLEFRRAEWWAHTGFIGKLGALFCSVDAPGLPRDLIVMHGRVYLRMHGRTSWYDYIYSEEELLALAADLRRSGASVIAVYFNNDTGMLENALTLSKILRAREGSL